MTLTQSVSISLVLENQFGSCESCRKKTAVLVQMHIYDAWIHSLINKRKWKLNKEIDGIIKLKLKLRG